MLIIEHTLRTKASIQTIWNLYEDHDSWLQWDKAIDMVQLHGPFEKGTKGTIKMKGGPKVSFIVSDLQKPFYFQDISNLLGAKLIFSHRVTQEGSLTKVTHTVEMTGPLSFIFSQIIGRQIKKDLPTAMKNLIHLAEEREMQS